MGRIVENRTWHFQGRYQLAGRHLFRGMRRWAHESRYARGSFASDISFLEAAVCVLASLRCCGHVRIVSHVRLVVLALLDKDGGRTGVGTALAEAHCIFDGFGDGHFVWYGMRLRG